MIFLVMHMRTFYIFKINKEFKTITKNKPYNLFLALDNIHNMPNEELSLACRLFDEICDSTNAKELNLSIFNALKNSDYYIKFNNNHLINQSLYDNHDHVSHLNNFVVYSSLNKQIHDIQPLHQTP